MKKIFAFMTALVMCFGLAVPVIASVRANSSILVPIYIPTAAMEVHQTNAASDISAYMSNSERGVLNIVNRERMAAGLLPVSTFPALQLAARQRAQELDAMPEALWGHVRPDGRSWATVLPEFGITSAGSENLARGSITTAEFAMNMWRNSPGHWNNIMTASHRHLGVGHHPRSFAHQWVQIFLEGCDITSIRVAHGQTEISLPFGTRIEEMDITLILTCSVHGDSFLPVISEMVSAYNSMSPTRQAVTIRYGELTTTIHVTPTQTPTIREMFPCPGLALAVANAFASTTMLDRRVTVDDMLTPATLAMLQTFEIELWTVLPITSFEGIRHLPELRRLTIRTSNAARNAYGAFTWGDGGVNAPNAAFHPVSDLSPLAALPNLIDLQIHAENLIGDLSPLSAIASLIRLTINNSLVEDLTPLAAANLERLTLNDNSIESLAPLGNLRNLTHLEVQHSNVSDITGLERLHAMIHLNLNGNQISDISPVAGMRVLYWLDMNDNQIVSLAPLSNLPSLRRLNLNNNLIRDIGPLAALPILETLSLQFNPITDVRPLANLQTLDFISLRGCPVDDVSPLDNLRNLRVLIHPDDVTTADGRRLAQNLREMVNSDAASIEPISVPAPNLSTASAWAHEAITTAIAAGLVPATLQGAYTQAITRAEFAALAAALYETATSREITGRLEFNDTTDVSVQKMGYLGVVTGVGGGRFAPYQTLTREQSAVMLARLASAAGQPLPQAAPTFADNADISSWAVEAVGQMQSAEIMSGTGNNNFSPSGDYTREQSIITILRLFDILN